jgi:hypothetical protein
MAHLEDDFLDDDIPLEEISDEELDAIFTIDEDGEEWDSDDEDEWYDDETDDDTADEWDPTWDEGHPLDILEDDDFIDRLEEIYQELRDMGFAD